MELYNKIDEKLKYEELLNKLLIDNASKTLVEKLMQFLYNENRFRDMLAIHNKYKEFDIKLPALFNNFEKSF